MARNLSCRVRDDRQGGALIEFALAAPLVLAMLIGILQVGMHVQNSSALKSVASDAARSIAIDYQKSLTLTNLQMEERAFAIAVSSPYMLLDERLDVTITDQPTRIAGAIEKKLTMTYVRPSFLGFIGIDDSTSTYSRPIFLTATPTGA